MSEAQMHQPLLEVKGLKEYFDINMGFFRTKPLKAVDDVSFTINKGETLGWAKPDFDDSAWIDFDVPGSWTDRKLAGNGSVWIRREIEIPAAWEGKELELRLGGIDKHDVTYFNGVNVGASAQGFDEAFWNVSRFYKVPAELVKAGRAVIAIRAFSFIFDGGFGGRPSSYALVRIDDPEQAVPLAGTWKFSVEADFGKVLLPEVSNLPEHLVDSL